jgi:hypothetical protein
MTAKADNWSQVFGEGEHLTRLKHWRAAKGKESALQEP